MPETEIRTISAEGLEFRAGDDTQGPVISGLGAAYNSYSLDLGGFKEVIAPGAFDRTLKSGREVRAFFNHDPGRVLGSTKAGNLTLTTDERGLHYTIDPLPATTYAADLAEAMRAKLVRGSSFTFLTQSDSWHEEKGVQIRTLLDVDLIEVGPVVMPAYPKANSQVRALLESRGIKLGEQRGDDCEPEDMLEMLSGRAFDEMLLACLIEEASDILELAALAPSRAGDPSIIDLAARMVTEAQAEVAMLRDFQTRFLAGEAPPAPLEENSHGPPPRLATLRRRLELLKRAH